MRAKSRLKHVRRRNQMRLVKHVVAVICGGFLLGATLFAGLKYFASLVDASAPTIDTQIIERPVEVIKEVEVDRTFTTEKQQILAYLVEKFGDDSEKAITMIYKCENSTFAADRMSPLNIQKSGRRSYDIGVMQINVDELNVEEQEKLKNYKYNIDRGYAKYKAAGNKFTAWTCAHIVGQKNYLGQ